jgi:RNA polymerase sigma-70 factor (ECF subfamily)
MTVLAFQQELLPHTPFLRRLARRFNARDAEDLVQETFLRALGAHARYRPGSNGRAWLGRILCNLAVSDLRRRRRDARLAERLRGLDAEVAAAAPLLRADRLRAALAQLSDGDREILELAEVEQRSYLEIARALSCPLGTVMSRLFRARRRLRQAVAPERTDSVHAGA